MPVLNYKTDAVGPGAINIMRPHRFSNPYPITRQATRSHVINLYARWLVGELKAGRISIYDLAELKGKDLVCCCKPLRCHGDILEAVAEWAYEVVRAGGSSLSGP